jgi:hypothetical protein
MLIDKFQLKEWRGIYGIRYYASIMAARMAQKGTEVKSDVSWVYTSKSMGAIRSRWSLLYEPYVNI